VFTAQKPRPLAVNLSMTAKTLKDNALRGYLGTCRELSMKPYFANLAEQRPDYQGSAPTILKRPRKSQPPARTCLKRDIRRRTVPGRCPHLPAD